MGLWAAAGLLTFVRHPLNDQHPRSTHYNIAISHPNRAISGWRRKVDDTMGRVLGKSIFLHLGYSPRGSVPHPSFYFFYNTHTAFLILGLWTKGSEMEDLLSKHRMVQVYRMFFFPKAFLGVFQEAGPKRPLLRRFVSKPNFFQFFFKFFFQILFSMHYTP